MINAASDAEPQSLGAVKHICRPRAETVSFFNPQPEPHEFTNNQLLRQYNSGKGCYTLINNMNYIPLSTLSSIVRSFL
jgi:hypothetical protein